MNKLVNTHAPTGAPNLFFFHFFFIFEGVGGVLGTPFTPGANPSCDGPVYT